MNWHGYSINTHVKLAITVWNQRIAPVFESSGKAVILEFRDNVLLSRSHADIHRNDPSAKARFLRGQGIHELICGAISRDVEDLVREQGIRIHPFIAGNLEEIIQARMDGRLDDGSFRMPGCGDGVWGNGQKEKQGSPEKGTVTKSDKER